MKAADRRKEILRMLQNRSEPISASQLAKDLGVSRQIIVGDVALLRAEEHSILATPRGYLLQPLTAFSEGAYVKKIVCQHGPEEVEKELTILLTGGAKVLDVEIEHPIYGMLTGNLNIASQEDKDRFLEDLSHYQGSLLSNLTGGVHSHTVSFPSVQAYQTIVEELKHSGILLSDD